MPLSIPRLPSPIARSDVASTLPSQLTTHSPDPGTRPFTKVLAKHGADSLLSAYFTFETAPDGPPGPRRQSLYTGMTPHLAYSRPCPKKEDYRVLPI